MDGSNGIFIVLPIVALIILLILVGLPRRIRRPLHPEPRQVVPRPAGRKQLDRAAGQAEGGRPHRTLARIADHVFHRGQQDATRQRLFQSH